MSRQHITHYFCDACGKELTNKLHLHLENVKWFGFVKPPKFDMKNLEERYLDFCDIDNCFTKFVFGKTKKKGAKK
jgi:hypothetical protein